MIKLFWGTVLVSFLASCGGEQKTLTVRAKTENSISSKESSDAQQGSDVSNEVLPEQQTAGTEHPEAEGQQNPPEVTESNEPPVDAPSSEIPPDNDGPKAPLALWSEPGMVVKMEKLWQTPSASLLSHNQYTPVVHFKGSTYFVWVDGDLRAWVTKITAGNVKTVPLDASSDYRITDDGHNRFSLGIDKDGYLHITGDMHNYTYNTTECNGRPYPTRYQKQAMLYWKSKRAEDIESGFAFAGGRGATTAMPGTGWTYGRFFTDNNGELYYSSRVKAIHARHANGEMGLGLYRYDAAAKGWTALGGEADRIREGEYYKVILWENGGVAPDGWYQGFLSQLKFDSQNRLHLASAINTDTSLAGNDRLVYAVSSDHGVTWKRASGSKIDGLPIRAIDNHPSQGDIVGEASDGNFFNSLLSVAADRDGRPSIAMRTTRDILLSWNGKQWVPNEHLTRGNVPLPSSGHQSADGSLIMVAGSTSQILHSKSTFEHAYAFGFADYKGIVSIDDYALRKDGHIYGVGLSSDGQSETIVKAHVIAAPLPCTWKSQDIASSGGPGYRGLAGFSDDTFVVTNYGVSIDGAEDSLHFVYQELSGNGSIVARVEANGPSRNGRAGLMIRESLEPGSRHVALTIGLDQQRIFAFRSTKGGATTNSKSALSAQPYWVKLTRDGKMVRGFVSADGESWQEAGQASLDLPSTAYLGMASASYHRYGMMTAEFDHVAAPGCEL